MKDVKFLPNKARLTIQGLYLNAAASIDGVRHIEDAGKVVECNDVARQILKFDSQPSTGTKTPLAYQGKGQVIAVADTGLDKGEREQEQPHPAFCNRVRGWIATHAVTEDRNGHGTHVCDSSVGGDVIVNGNRAMGTAPQAELIVQSIWDPAKGENGGIRPPEDLTALFDPPYRKEAVRVHSNSWSTNWREEDPQGNPIPFRQMGYTTGAKEIDKFVYEHREMVTCSFFFFSGFTSICNPLGYDRLNGHMLCGRESWRGASAPCIGRRTYWSGSRGQKLHHSRCQPKLTGSHGPES